MYVENTELAKFRGLNPSFAKRVWERRRAEEAARERAEMERRVAFDKAERERLREEYHARREAERKASMAIEAYRVIEVRPANTEQRPAKEILQGVSIATGISVGLIMGPSRLAPVCAARHQAIRAIANERPDLSLPQIGKIMGGKDHTTILSSLRKTRKPGQPR